MNPISTSTFASIVFFARAFGRPSALRALTLSQSTIKGLPGRQNKDIAEIQAQSAQTAEQLLQLAESVFDPNWSDPDIQAVAEDATVDALKANLAAHDGA